MGGWASARHPITGKNINTRRRAKTEAAAKRLEREIVREIEEKIRAQVVPTWALVIESYLNACKQKDLCAKTIYNADKCLKAATLPVWKDRLVDTITTDEIRDLICNTFGHTSESNRKALLKFIRQSMETALEVGVINRNPAPTMKFNVGRKLKSVLTYEQAKFLLNKAKELEWAWYPHVLMAVYTGMRNGELFALTWDKVDFEISRIRVDCSWNNKDGFKETKSGDDRNVDIAPELVVFLKELKLETGHTGFVLPRIGRWAKGEQARELNLFLNAIGLPPIRFHDLRATWATLMLSRGVEAVKVMSLGGWREFETMDRYIRKAGIDTQGISHVLKIHDPSAKVGQVVRIRKKVNSDELLTE